MPKRSKRVQVEIDFVEREFVESLAGIVGESSAARQVLDASRQYPNPVFFRYAGILIVADASSFFPVQPKKPKEVR